MASNVLLEISDRTVRKGGSLKRAPIGAITGRQRRTTHSINSPPKKKERLRESKKEKGKNNLSTTEGGDFLT